MVSILTITCIRPNKNLTLEVPLYFLFKYHCQAETLVQSRLIKLIDSIMSSFNLKCYTKQGVHLKLHISITRVIGL